MPVAARFHEVRDRVVASVDKVFAEPVKLSFLKDGAPDSNRPAVEIDAVIRVAVDRETSLSGEFRTRASAKVSAGPAQMWIDAAVYTGPALRPGDAVRVLARNGQPWFEVLHVGDRGEARIVVTLGEK